MPYSRKLFWDAARIILVYLVIDIFRHYIVAACVLYSNPDLPLQHRSNALTHELITLHQVSLGIAEEGLKPAPSTQATSTAAFW